MAYNQLNCFFSKNYCINYNITGLSIILKDRVFYSKYDCSVLFLNQLNGRNVVSLRTAVDECYFCWFANCYEHLAEN